MNDLSHSFHASLKVLSALLSIPLCPFSVNQICSSLHASLKCLSLIQVYKSLITPILIHHSVVRGWPIQSPDTPALARCPSKYGHGSEVHWDTKRTFEAYKRSFEALRVLHGYAHTMYPPRIPSTATCTMYDDGGRNPSMGTPTGTFRRVHAQFGTIGSLGFRGGWTVVKDSLCSLKFLSEQWNPDMYI